MKNFIFGNKDLVALELNIQPDSNNNYGHLRIWIGGNFIGSIEESQTISTVVYNLEGLATVNENVISLSDKSESGEYLLKKFDSQASFLLTLGECFDDFHICAARHVDELVFIWQLHEDPYFSYENYPKNVLKITMKITDYEDCIERIKSGVSNI